MHYPMNPTSKRDWPARPSVRSAHRTLVPLVANSPWSQALGPTHLAWMMQKEPFERLPAASTPDVWFVYRTNPAISFWDTDAVGAAMARFPFTVCFAYTRDETNHMADVLLPDCTDLEGLQLLRIGGTKYVEQFWVYQGFALRDPVASAQGEARDFTWIATELARRAGILEAYNAAINRGVAGVRLNGKSYDFSLDVGKPHGVETIWDAICRAANAELTDGAESQGLDYFREHGFRVKPFSRLQWYLYPKLVSAGLRFEQPYQERLFRIGKELGRRLHEQDIHWWDRQLAEYEPLPHWRDLNGLWEGALARHFQVQIADYPFWLITARSMQYSWGGNVGLQLIKELADNVAGHGRVVMNRSAGEKLRLGDGDLVEVRSPLNHTRGRVMLCEGIRPDTLLMIGQFDHWATPYAKEFAAPSMNALTPMLLELTDATGSSADLVKVKVTRMSPAGERAS
jgi:phenylacetyl-CoA:acceptor oxidoreductase